LDSNVLTINAKVDLKGLLRLKEVLLRYEGMLRFLAQESDPERAELEGAVDAAEK
jgi:hypothetical protein